MMIDLHARAISDSQKIHNNLLGVGGDSISVTFTKAGTTTSQTIKAKYTDVAFAVTPDTNFVFTSGKIAISFHRSDLTIWTSSDSLNRWTVSFTNAAGQVVTGEIKDVHPDNTFGDVLIFIELTARA